MKITPYFMYGTAWKEERTEKCVLDALSVGFRAIDTANQRKHYFEAGVGAALKKAGVPRSELFVQTKFTFIDGQDDRLPYDADASVAEQVQQSFESSLEHLSTDYLDSYVLHGPSTVRGLADDDWEAWGAMEGIFRSGVIKHLGVSNVSLEQLRLLVERAQFKPQFVQNRCFARRAWDKPIRDYCRQHGIVYQGFSLLTANVQIFSDQRFVEVMNRVGCTPAQLVFAFAGRVGMLPLTGTTDPAHMREDLDFAKFTLTDADVNIIENLCS
jgi:diketogulonate reductase-like aldo/keto reductase